MTAPSEPAIELWQAIQDGDDARALELLEDVAGHSSATLNPQGRTPLMWACFLGRRGLASRGRWDGTEAAQDEDGSNAAMWAVRGGNAACLDASPILEPRILFAQRDKRGRSALDIAMDERCIDCVAELWRLADFCTKYKRSPTWFEDLTGRAEPEVRALAALSASVGFAEALTSFTHGPDELAEALLRPDVAARTREGRAPLHIAAGAGMHEVVSALLKRGADPAALDSRGATPLMCAASLAYADARLSYASWGARRDHRKAAKILMERFDPMWIDDGGTTALMAAASNGDAAMVELLLPGSNPFERFKFQRDTFASAAAYHVNASNGASEEGRAACIALIDRAYVAGHAAYAAGPDAQGSIFRKAALEGNVEKLRSMLDAEEQRIAAGRSSDRSPLALRVDDRGVTALMAAARRGHAECVRELASRSNSLASTDAGLTALMFAAKSPDPSGECARMLVHLSHLNARDEDRLTAFEHAAANKTTAEPLRALLKHIPSIPDRDPWERMLAKAIDSKNLAAVESLVRSSEGPLRKRRLELRHELAQSVNDEQLAAALREGKGGARPS